MISAMTLEELHEMERKVDHLEARIEEVAPRVRAVAEIRRRSRVMVEAQRIFTAV